ncbi:MAG: hypothetical protein LUQ69_02065 [Methanoregulaceae archaeon]|nr:hypothetical protein [Methanoregulaceae archaeon]
MSRDKHIERCIGEYIARYYRKVVEIGVGSNTVAARVLNDAGVDILCTDIRPTKQYGKILVLQDDICAPDLAIYENASLLYSIRPGEEMMVPLIALARRVNADLIVYHLGFECYGDGGEIIDCGVILHRYYRQKPSSVA